VEGIEWDGAGTKKKKAKRPVVTKFPEKEPHHQYTRNGRKKGKNKNIRINKIRSAPTLSGVQTYGGQGEPKTGVTPEQRGLQKADFWDKEECQNNLGGKG